MEWRPTKRQEEFLSIPDSVSEALYGGAAGGGKSEVLIMLPIVREFYKKPRFKGLLLRRTYPELEKSLILRSQEWYPHTGGDYNRQLRRWKWPSGAIIDFGYAENEQDVRRYDTTEYNYIGWDELTSFTEFQYLYISKSRCRSSDPGLPAIVRGGTNPGNIGHGWVRSRFVEPAPYGTLIKDKRSGQLRIFIQSLLTDNSYLMKADPGYIKSLEQMPEAEKRAKLYGDWWTFSGQVFDDFRCSPLSDEPSNAQHVIPAFTIPPYWPRILFMDWGYSAFNYVGKLAASPTGRAYQYYEDCCKQQKIAEWGKRVKLSIESANETFVDRVIDPSGFFKTGAELTIAEQISKELDLSFRPADNDRLGGKTLIQEYLRWRPKAQAPPDTPPAQFDNDLAQHLLRWKGMKAYEAYLDSFLPEKPEENLPRIQFFDNCKEMIKTLPLCVYNIPGKGNTEDVAEFTGDDPYDALRYGLKAIHRYFEMAKRNMKGIEARENILSDFARTKDYTVLHNRMGKLERHEHKGKSPLRRYHRAGVANRAF